MTQASTNPPLKVGAEQHEGGWLGTYTHADGRIAVVAEGFPTREQAHAAVDRFLTTKEVDPDPIYRWEQDLKYPDRYAVCRIMRTGQVLVREYYIRC